MGKPRQGRLVTPQQWAHVGGKLPVSICTSPNSTLCRNGLLLQGLPIPNTTSIDFGGARTFGQQSDQSVPHSCGKREEGNKQDGERVGSVKGRSPKETAGDGCHCSAAVAGYSDGSDSTSRVVAACQLPCRETTLGGGGFKMIQHHHIHKLQFKESAHSEID